MTTAPGEITYAVNFTNLWGEPGEGQLILWDVYNRSAESVSVLGIGTIPSHGSAFVRNTTDAAGNSSIEVDAEVVSFLSITASTATENTAGKALDLAIDFSAAWAAAKPLAALPLAQFAESELSQPIQSGNHDPLRSERRCDRLPDDLQHRRSGRAPAG